MDPHKISREAMAQLQEETETYYRGMRRQIVVVRVLQFTSLLSACIFVGLMFFVACEAEAGSYRAPYVQRSLNKLIIVNGNKVRTIPGGSGTHFIFERKNREYYRGPQSCLRPYREHDRNRKGKRRSRHHHTPCG